MTKINFNKLVKKITNAVVEVANEKMSDMQLRISDKKTVSWLRRRFSLLNGNMATVSLDNGKVLDVGPLSRTLSSM